MEFHSYNKELAVANLQFKRIFNNISVVENGKKIRFYCVIGNRSRIIKGLQNSDRNGTYKLPMIIIERTGINRNNDRLANINNEIKHQVHSSRQYYDLYTPVPVDISYQVSIVSKYQDHIDRAISNIIPFFNKDLYVRCKHPKYEEQVYTNQIVMDDSITEEHPDEIDASTDDIITCNLNFTFKTYLFCGNKSTPGSSIHRKISTVLSTDENGESCEVQVVKDTAYIGFVPQIRSIDIGFYPVPLLSSYNDYMDTVDNMDEDEQQYYKDELIWKIDQEDETSENIITDQTFTEI